MPVSEYDQPEPGTVAADAFADALARSFAVASLALPDPVPNEGSLAAEGWAIRYVVNLDDNGHPVLDFFADHRLAGPRVGRLPAGGEVELLDSFVDHFTSDSESEEDQDEGRRQMEEHNRRITDDLTRKGLI